MHVIDWVWTGAVGLSIDEIGHFWKVKGYSITNASFKEVDNQPQDAAIIEFLSK